MPWRRERLPTPVFLPGKYHGEGTLESHSPWGCKRVRHDLVTKQNNPTLFRAEIHTAKVFVGRTDSEAETPVLWAPHAKSWLIGKDPDAGRDWGQEEKGTTEDEMAGWHHWLDGREFEWTPGVGDGQGGPACCDSWGCKELDMTEWLNWTELKGFVFPAYSAALSGQRDINPGKSRHWWWGGGDIVQEGSEADSAETCENLSFFFSMTGMWMGWLETAADILWSEHEDKSYILKKMENEKFQIISFLIILELSYQPQTTFLCNRQTKKQNLLLAKSSRICYCCNMQPNCFLDNTQSKVLL